MPLHVQDFIMLVNGDMNYPDRIICHETILAPIPALSLDDSRQQVYDILHSGKNIRQT